MRRTGLAAALLAWLLALTALPAIGPDHRPAPPPPSPTASSYSQLLSALAHARITPDQTVIVLRARVRVVIYVGMGDPVNQWDPSGLDWYRADPDDGYYYWFPGSKDREGYVKAGKQDDENTLAIPMNWLLNQTKYADEIDENKLVQRSGLLKAEIRLTGTLGEGLAINQKIFRPEVSWPEWSPNGERSIYKVAKNGVEQLLWMTMSFHMATCSFGLQETGEEKLTL